jgi:hypothetical protein
VNRERAETRLRLLAEAELRRSTAPPANGTAGQRDVPSLALAAELLCTVGAVDVGAMEALPVLWIRDSSGRWHTTQTNGYYPTKTTGEVILPMAIVPPLAVGTPWADMFAAGQSAEISARLPLHWT